MTISNRLTKPNEYLAHEPPGFAVITNEQPHYAASAEVIRHDGVTVIESGNATKVIKGAVVELIRFAFYSERVLRNGWEPFDQPHPAAYMPLRYTTLERVDVAGGAFFIQRHAVHQALWRALPIEQESSTLSFISESHDELMEVISAMLLRAGLPPAEAQRCAMRVSDKLHCHH